MNAIAGLFWILVAAAMAAPSGASLLNVEEAPVDLPLDTVDVEMREDGSVEVFADTSSVSPALGEQGVPVGPRGAVAHVLSPDTAAAPSSAAKAATAAVGTALGVGILVGLWNYLKYGALAGIGGPLFSRIAANKILDNGVRGRVHDAIGENPGITIKEITTLLGIGWGTAVYHLARLEQERLVVSERHRQFRRYFRNGGGIVNDDKTAYAELKNPTTQRIAAQILERPGSAQKELCEVVGISAPLAHKHLARLEVARLLTKEREWKTVKYFPTTKLAELLPGDSPAPGLVLVPA